MQKSNGKEVHVYKLTQQFKENHTGILIHLITDSKHLFVI